MNEAVRPVHGAEDLLGFWQFTLRSGHYVVILERSAGRTRSTLTVKRFLGGDWVGVKSASYEENSVKAIDGTIVGDDLLICMEINRSDPLQIARADIAQVVDPATEGIPFEPVAVLGPSEAQTQKVDLQESWHAAGFLAPEQWLFSPRFVRDSDPPQVIANTADGQAMLFAEDAESEAREAFAIAGAAEPRALVAGAGLAVAFKRHVETAEPIRSLPRYSGPMLPKQGALIVRGADGTEVDLSGSLGLGPVIRFALATDAGRRPWLFALREAPVGTDLLALARTEAGWELRATLELDGEAEEIDALHANGSWHVVYGLREGNGWSLRHLEAPPGP